jgi:S1-C subfamily serine protease
MRVRTVAIAAFLASLSACAEHQVLEEDRMIDIAGEPEPAADTALPSLVKSTGPSYVTLTIREAAAQRSKKDNSSPARSVTSGSGFIVEPTGYVVTAAHVAVQAGNVVSARGSDGRVYSGKVIGINAGNDIALIKLKGFSGRAATPSSRPCLTRGQKVYSLGKPHSQGDTARIGEVESMHFGRAVRYGAFGYPDAVVLRMATKKGESGGPLFNRSGELAGMIVSTLSDGNGQPLNLAHAVPTTNIAAYVCQNINCKGRWQSLSRASTERCTAT